MELEDVSFQFLREITDGFSENRIFGEGAFGVVYKGVTKNGDDVAVKKLKLCDVNLDFKQFQNEFYNLTKLKHQNVVQILGYCYEIEKKPFIMPDGSKVFVDETHIALCFQYLHNGSLEKHLCDDFYELDWHTRFKIIKGICEGLKYIHDELEEPIYQLDLKSENILLDKDMVPKIADFGLSRIFCNELARITRNPYGTLGYQPPEYIDKGEISGMFDIFSLGVVIIKIVSGPRGYTKCLDMSSDEFNDQVQRDWRNRLEATCTGTLLEAYCHQVETCAQIALNCVETDSQKRPDIMKITEKLNELEFDTGKTSEGYYEQATFFTMHDLVHDLAISLVGNQILDQNKQGNTRGSSCQYALLRDCSRPLELSLTSHARLVALRFLEGCRSKLSGAAFAPARYLRILDLSECSIHALPDSIGQLRQLRYLNAPQIQDIIFPECITRLSNLIYLNLYGSSICTLTKSIGKLERLMHLDLSNCRGIHRLPVSLRNLEKLAYLDLSNCSYITSVSESLRSLSRLEHLNLSCCRMIGDLTGAISGLTELQYLNLSGVSCIGLQQVLVNLTKLRKYLKLSTDFESSTTKDEKSGARDASHDANALENLPAQQFSLGNWIGCRQMLPVADPSSAVTGVFSTTPFDISLQSPALPPTTPGSLYTFAATGRPHVPLPSTSRTEYENKADERRFSEEATGSETGRCCLKRKREMN